MALKWSPKEWKRSLKALISRLCYRHGLFCSSHPFAIISLVIVIFLFICYPLAFIPLPGNAPLEHSTPVFGYSIPNHLVVEKQIAPPTSNSSHTPRWYRGPPVSYVQQILYKVAVSPWSPHTQIPSDAIRASLRRSFTLRKHINEFQHVNGKRTTQVSDYCLKVGDIVKQQAQFGVLPEFSCLQLSPAAFWANDVDRFDRDSQIVKTVYKSYGPLFTTSPSLRDLLFGVCSKSTGIKRFYFRNRRRVVTFAVTIVFKTYDQQFIDSLHKYLSRHHRVDNADFNVTTPLVTSKPRLLTHVYYPPMDTLVEYGPLAVTYVLLFLYIYFSVRKIEMVKSKWGLAFSAIVTVIASLMMSYSICLLFGLSPNLNGGEIFPYLVIIVGFENILVMTKSIVSTPIEHDVKLRVAQGLSREGWHMVKNLVAEILILILGIFTMVPAVQEFCLFAIFGLISDFFLQTVFFVTVLSIDIRRMELTELQYRQRCGKQNTDDVSKNNANSCPIMSSLEATTGYDRLPPVATVAKAYYDIGGDGDRLPREWREPYRTIVLPRRVRLMNFWARTRLMQRITMACVIVWISLIIYKAGILQLFIADSAHSNNNNNNVSAEYLFLRKDGMKNIPQDSNFDKLKASLVRSKNSFTKFINMQSSAESKSLVEDDLTPLSHTEFDQWKLLSHSHWPRLFSLYNITLNGRYLTILPSIHLSSTISPTDSQSLRHPHDHKSTELLAHDFNDYVDDSHDTIKAQRNHNWLTYLRYSTRTEIILTFLLVIATSFLIVNVAMILMKRAFPRPYARWTYFCTGKRLHRTNWYCTRLQDTVPLVLQGHSEEIECITCNGPLVVSSCLAGDIKVWDSQNGQCLNTLSRKTIQRKPYSESFSSVTSSTSPDPQRKSFSRNASFNQLNPDLSDTIRTDFQCMKNEDRSHSISSETGFDFNTKFQPLYDDHEVFLKDQADYQDEYEPIVKSPLPEQNEGCPLPCEDDLAGISPPGSIWCLASRDHLVAVGLSTGDLELWHTLTGLLITTLTAGAGGGSGATGPKCTSGSCSSRGSASSAITALCFVADRLIASRFNGDIDFLTLDIDNCSSTADTGANTDTNTDLPSTSIVKSRIVTHAHHRPITFLLCEQEFAISASEDRSLKVHSVKDARCLYTLHGHLASITALDVNTTISLTAASGDADGCIRLWSLEASSVCAQHTLDTGHHCCRVTSVTSQRSKVISAALDNRLCIWERRTGCLLHWIHMEPGSCNSLVMLKSNLLLTGGQGCIYLWDLTLGKVMKVVTFRQKEGGGPTSSMFVHRMCVVREEASIAVICGVGSRLQIVHFTSVQQKIQ